MKNNYSFATKRIPKTYPNLPKLLSSIYDPKYESWSLEDLRNIELDLSITEEEQEAVRKATEEQLKCRMWFNHRIK